MTANTETNPDHRVETVEVFLNPLVIGDNVIRLSLGQAVAWRFSYEPGGVPSYARQRFSTEVRGRVEPVEDAAGFGILWTEDAAVLLTFNSQGGADAALAGPFLPFPRWEGAWGIAPTTHCVVARLHSVIAEYKVDARGIQVVDERTITIQDIESFDEGYGLDLRQSGSQGVAVIADVQPIGVDRRFPG